MKGNIAVEDGINILSLGSLAGVLSQMHILAKLMDQLTNSQNVKEDLLPSDHFDLIGASGIAALAALCIGPLKMSAKSAIEALQVLGLSVFYEHHGQPRATIFDSNELQETLRNLIEGAGCSPDTMIGAVDPNSNCKCVFFVSPTIDITSCHRLRTYRGRKGMLQCTILEVALASMSTLGLFEPAEIGSNRRKYTSVGMHHTNPIKDVLDEAEQLFGKEQRVALVLSLGCGSGSDGIIPSNLTHLDVYGLLQAMDMQQRVTTEEVGRQFGSLEAYYRFSVEGIGSNSLNDWIYRDVDEVESQSRIYLDDPRRSMALAPAVQQLEGRRGTVTLNSLNHASGVTVVVKKVPSVTPFFVLRKKAWAFIENNLANAPMDKRLIFLLSGLGGCGKSTLFSHYVQVYGHKYSHVFIIDASSVHSIKIDLQNAVRSLGSENSQKTWEDALKYFEREGANKNWLIGFESADDPTLPLHELIPKSDHGTIFITSRNRDLFLLTTKELQWELGPMTTEEALDTLLHSAQRAMTPSQDDLENGTELVERLGRLPLAVVQAGAYCFQKSLMIDGLQVQFTFRHYLGEMDRYSRDVMEHSATHSLEGYNKSVYQSLSMSCSALPQRARDFLHLCGYLNHSQIPLIMFDYAVDGRFRVVGMTGSLDSQPVIEAKLASILESPGKSTIIHLHKLVYTLKMFSLVVTSMAPNSMMLNFHALVSAWSRDTLSLEQKQFYSALATRVVSTCSAEDQYYRVHASLLPHITEILKQPGDLHLNDMHSLAGRLDWGGMTREAEAIYRRMQERCIKDFGMSDRKTLIALENLANCLNRQGRHEEAMEMQQVAILGRRKLHPENDREILQVENNLATTYLSQERWREAEEILTRILPMLKQTLGIRDPNTTGAMINLANAYGQQGRHQEAVEIHREALEIRRQVCGNDHPDTLLEMTNLANSYIRLNRLDEAQKLEEEALEMMKNTNGMDNPMTLRTMSNLAETYSVQGKHTEALALGEQALEGRKRVLGRRHPDVLKTMCLVAMIYFQLDLIPEGVQLQEELRELEGGEGNFSKVLSGNLALWFNI